MIRPVHFCGCLACRSARRKRNLWQRNVCNIVKPVANMRIKFEKLKSKRTDTYVIGYLRYDNKCKLFSLEKKFSSKVNCTMTRYDDFREGSLKPFASTELEFLSDTLSENELKIFDAWERYARSNPVQN